MTGRPALQGRFALVTGGTSTGGAAIVRRLSQAGATVAFTGSDAQRGEAIAGETGARFGHVDPSDRHGSDTGVKQALSLAPGRLDVLVTNSERRSRGSIEATPEPELRALLEANLTFVFRVSRACWETMQQVGGGSMIHVTSDAGIHAAHEMAAYSVASAGVIAVAELLGAEGAPHGIRANAVCAGDSVAAADVASAVVWLAGDESAHVNGATLRVDGGTGAAMVADTRA
jgi:3-oxoacyl-[acyl-carrier protein] reductase